MARISAGVTLQETASFHSEGRFSGWLRLQTLRDISLNPMVLRVKDGEVAGYGIEEAPIARHQLA